jgi:hypothetical protein
VNRSAGHLRAGAGYRRSPPELGADGQGALAELTALTSRALA